MRVSIKDYIKYITLQKKLLLDNITCECLQIKDYLRYITLQNIAAGWTTLGKSVYKGVPQENYITKGTLHYKILLPDYIR